MGAAGPERGRPPGGREMVSVTVDEKLAGSLISGGKLVEVKDTAGKVIGFFAPISMDLADRYVAMASQYYPIKDMPKLNPNGRDYTTAEVLEYLKSLEQK
jgi:hypothetical protein